MPFHRFYGVHLNVAYEELAEERVRLTKGPSLLHSFFPKLLSNEEVSLRTKRLNPRKIVSVVSWRAFGACTEQSRAPGRCFTFV